jgi:hypothetical protein
MVEALKEYEAVGFMSWAGEYEVLHDNTGLTESSSRRFLTDMLSVVRRGIERKRTFSVSSGSSTGSKGISSTPKSGVQSTLSLTPDMAYGFDTWNKENRDHCLTIII